MMNAARNEPFPLVKTAAYDMAADVSDEMTKKPTSSMGDHLKCSHCAASQLPQLGDDLNQGLPFGDCLLLSALLHRASSAAGHTVEQ